MSSQVLPVRISASLQPSCPWGDGSGIVVVSRHPSTCWVFLNTSKRYKTCQTFGYVKVEYTDHGRPKFLVILSMIILAVGIWGTCKVWFDTSFLATFEKD
jgi:hypothetical protein